MKYNDLYSDSEILSIAQKTFDDEIEELLAIRSRLSSEFLKAIKLITAANKIIVTGVGKSGIIAKKIAATFSSIGVSSFFLHPVEALHGDIGTVQAGDVAILLSKSGNTEELLRLIPYLKIRQASIISIVGSADSYLSRHSDATLDAIVSREACPFNLAPTSSTTAALVMGDALAVAAMKLNNLSLDDFSKLHPLGQIGRNITLKVKDAMHSGGELPTIFREAPFKEALIEMSRKPLGCVCIVSENGTLEGIITDGDVRRLLQIHDNLKDILVEDIMTANPISIDENSLLLSALATMENRHSQINVLPVVSENNMLLGIIRLHDIIKSGT